MLKGAVHKILVRDTYRVSEILNLFREILVSFS